MDKPTTEAVTAEKQEQQLTHLPSRFLYRQTAKYCSVESMDTLSGCFILLLRLGPETEFAPIDICWKGVETNVGGRRVGVM